MKTIRHIAGPFRDNVQECIQCGELLCDYRNAMFESGHPPPKGWPIGEVYISGVNPQVFSTQRPVDTIVTDCTK